MSSKIIWFKAKTYGWGWTPCTWQDWLIILVYAVAITLNALQFNSSPHTKADVLGSFAPITIVLTLLLILITYATGEKPGWRWGNKKSKKG